MKSWSGIVFRKFFFLVLLFGFSNPGLAAKQKIAIFKFTVHSEKNMDFLEKGMFEMLSAKFSAENYIVEKVEAEKSNNLVDFLKTAKGAKPDYVISGNLMIFGNTMNLNAFLYDVQSGNKLIVFNKNDNNKDNLLPHINTFGDSVLERLGASEPVPVEKEATTEITETETEKPDQKMPDASPVLSVGVFKSPAIEDPVSSLTTGDVNGDGHREIIYIQGTDIIIAQYRGGQYNIINTIAGKHYLKTISVAAFDSNANGVEEIFVTSSHRNSKHVQSFVLEWNGTVFSETVEKSKWFFEILPFGENGKMVLVGQGQHFAEGLFRTGVFELALDKSGNEYIQKSKISIPENRNVYNLTSGDVMNTGHNNFVALSNNGSISVYDEKNREKWTSSDLYGGSLKYLEARKNDTNKRYYLSSRIIAKDIDEDGVVEIVTVKNDNASPKALVNLKNFKKGRIVCLVWDKLNFVEKWNTQTVSGYISDFNISDIDGDGKQDLIYCVVEKIGTFWQTKQAYFVIQPIGGQTVKTLQ